MPKQTYKKMIKQVIKDGSLEYLLAKRNKRNGKGMQMKFCELRMQNYLHSEDLDIQNYERKIIFQLRTQMHFKIKTHFQNMHQDIICDRCRKAESTTRHTLECSVLLYLPVKYWTSQ